MDHRLPRGYVCVYFCHVRKAAGTSLCHMLFGLGREDGSRVYRKALDTANRRLRSGDKVFVRWNQGLIERGSYFAAVSHLAAHKLHLPPRTVTLVCLRDPAERVLSHYRILLQFKLRDVLHPCTGLEGQWLGSGFDDFLCNIAKTHLLNQVYVFSADFDAAEAAERIMQWSHVMFTERFEEAVDAVSAKLGMTLDPTHARKASGLFSATLRQRQRLRSLLAPRYELYEHVNTCDESTVAA